jgi:signal transduction histidine kinase
VQVVSNLVSNAVQHTTKGGRINVRLAARAGEIQLSLSDDDAGMEADTAAREFDLFISGSAGA